MSSTNGILEEAEEDGYQFRMLKEEEVMNYLKPAHILEKKAFPPDEAATEESFLYRMTAARDFFYVLERNLKGSPEVIGYVVGTLANGDSLTHDSMYEHIPGAGLLCIHSVAVDPEFRRRGLATAMLKRYIKFMDQLHPFISTLTLICKHELISLYAGAGFSYIGKSDVVHGKDQWFEMSVTLSHK